MADSTITGLTAAGNPSGAEVLPCDQSSTTRKITVAQIAAFGNSGATRTARTITGVDVSNVGAGGVDQTQPGNPANTVWPHAAHITRTVPAWASRALVRATLTQIYAVTGPTNCNIAIDFAGVTGGGTRIRWNGANGVTGDVNLAAEFSCTVFRSQIVTVQTLGNELRDGVNSTGALRVGGNAGDSFAIFDVEFYEV